MESTTETPADKRSPLRRIAIGVAAFVLLAGGWLMWGTRPALPDGPLVARRGDDGRFQTEGDVSGGGAEGRLNALKVNQGRTTISSESSSDNTAVLARTVAVFNLSENLFGQRLGYELFKRLQETDRFREVRYLPHGESLPDGERLPDLFATIEVVDLKEGGIAPATSLDAKIRVTLSDQYQRSSHSYQETLTPPSLQFRWDSTIDCQAQNVGLETGSAKYAGVSQTLTKDIAKDLGEYLDKQIAKFGELIEPSPEFLPAYTPVADWEFLKPLGATRLMSGPRYMRSNVTVWRIEPKGEIGETLKAVADGLMAEGIESNELKNVESKTAFRVSSKKTGSIVECFEQQDGHFPRTGPRRVFLVSASQMSSKDIVAGLKAMIDRDEPEERLVTYSSVWHLEKQAVAEYFRKHPARLLPSVMHLARQEVKAGNKEAASSLVLRAAAFQQILKKESPGTELRKLAKEAGIESLPKLPDISVLIPESVVDLREPGSNTVRITGRQPVVALVSAADDAQRYVVLTRSAGPVNQERISFNVNGVTLQEHGQSWTTSGSDYRIGQKTAVDAVSRAPGEAGRKIWITIRAFDRDSATAEIVAE